MRRSADVVILMQQNFNLLYPNSINWEHWRKYKPDIPFSDCVIEYLSALSELILKDKEARLYPDVITFAFFCRRANILNLKKQYISDKFRLGRGILFHIAPSNVPINFGYSLVTGLLGGNYNVVRISSKYFPQVNMIIKHIHSLCESSLYDVVSKRIALVSYDRESTATDFFSSFCNVRIIWGGDNTIAHIRKCIISPRSFDITFSDRYSLAAINADKMIMEDSMSVIAESFYNDTYLFDQNACSAPRLVVWKGSVENIAKSKDLFWSEVQKLIDRKYELQSVLAIDKLTAMYLQAIDMDIHKEKTGNNRLICVHLNELPKDIDNYRCAGGYFSEYDVNSLNEIVHIIKEKYQTLAYYGFSKEELKTFVLNNYLIGLDRIVPIGKTTEFSLTWDGYNLIETTSRECSIS